MMLDCHVTSALHHVTSVLHHVTLFRRFILRNHIAQKAIECAERGDFSEVCEVLTPPPPTPSHLHPPHPHTLTPSQVRRVLQLLFNPYDPATDKLDLPSSEAISATPTGATPTSPLLTEAEVRPDDYSVATHYFSRPSGSALEICVT